MTTTTEADAWYYAKAGQQLGPVTGGELRGLLARGEVIAADLVWRAGMHEWAPAGSLPSFGGETAAADAALPGAVPGLEYYAAGAPTAEYAGFWLRLLAWIIDWVVTAVSGGLVGALLGAAIGVAMSGNNAGSNARAVATIVGQIVGTIIGWLYYALLESSPKQASLGKMALGLVVTDLNGGRVSFGRATGRHFAKILSALILAIGFVMIGVTQRKQGLHDMLAGTIVVKGRR